MDRKSENNPGEDSKVLSEEGNSMEEEVSPVKVPEDQVRGAQCDSNSQDDVAQGSQGSPNGKYGEMNMEARKFIDERNALIEQALEKLEKRSARLWSKLLKESGRRLPRP